MRPGSEGCQGGIVNAIIKAFKRKKQKPVRIAKTNLRLSRRTSHFTRGLTSRRRHGAQSAESRGDRYFGTSIPCSAKRTPSPEKKYFPPIPKSPAFRFTTMITGGQTRSIRCGTGGSMISLNHFLSSSIHCHMKFRGLHERSKGW